jgi:hypothetical protein
MRIISQYLIALALLGTIVQVVAPAIILVHAQPAPSVTPDGAFGLQVTAVRSLEQPNAMELVFGEPSAAMLREFSQRATGRDVDFVIGGRTIATLKLRDPITGNSVMLTGGFTAEVLNSINAATELGLDIRMRE